jgi:hypothetical protein
MTTAARTGTVVRSMPRLTTRWAALDRRPRTQVFDAAKDPKNWPVLHGKEVREPITAGPWNQAGDRRRASLRRLGRADCILEQLHAPVFASFTAKVKSGKEYRYIQLFLDCGGETQVLLLRERLSSGPLATAADRMTMVAKRLTPPIERLAAARGSRLVKPLAIGMAAFGLSWLSASRAADSEPPWPSVTWSALLPPMVIAAVFGLVAFLVARSMQNPRRRRGIIGRRIGGGFRHVVTVAAVVALSWSVEGLLHKPHGGEWTGLGVGLLLALLTGFLLWEQRRRLPM